jgi:hypothetical protein
MTYWISIQRYSFQMISIAPLGTITIDKQKSKLGNEPHIMTIDFEFTLFQSWIFIF